MSIRLPVEINPYRLVEQRKLLSGELSVTKLTRMQSLLCSDQGQVKVNLEFDRDELGLATISGKVDATLDLQCQRCLSCMLYELSFDIHVVLVKSQRHEERLQTGHDVILIEEDRLFIQEFIEDELLLALPLSTMHEDCEPSRPLIEALPEDEIIESETEEKENPFAALKDLKD
ncbi:MAG: DUF177 domain-containing protein [Thiotrichaceae bacterium]|nr:DUF177 domain-containing protein [Thiotrichaceae bacterium]